MLVPQAAYPVPPSESHFSLMGSFFLPCIQPSAHPMRIFESDVTIEGIRYLQRQQQWRWCQDINEVGAVVVGTAAGGRRQYRFSLPCPPVDLPPAGQIEAPPGSRLSPSPPPLLSPSPLSHPTTFPSLSTTLSMAMVMEPCSGSQAACRQAMAMISFSIMGSSPVTRACRQYSRGVRV